MTIKKIIELLEAGQEHNFYISSAWRKKCKEVLKLDNFECQMCKSDGKYSKATLVHHINHLKDRPDLALSIYEDTECTKRNLLSVCDKCHKTKCHPEMLKHFNHSSSRFKNSERWD